MKEERKYLKINSIKTLETIDHKIDDKLKQLSGTEAEEG